MPVSDIRSHRLKVVAPLALAIVALWSPGAVRHLFAQGPPQGLPSQASARAEEVVEGELEVQYEDGPTTARLVHHLRVGNERLEMVFEDGEPPALEHGTRVRARGQRKDNVLSLKSGRNVEVVGLASSSTFGQQRTLVLLVNFQDNTSMPENPTSVYTTTFETVNGFYQENSYGQTWLTGDVFGYFTLPMTSGTCDYNGIASRAESAATGAGINVGAYSRRIFVFPRIGACGWWGLGNVGGNPSRAWVNGTYALFVAAHELGHNFGNHHSKSQPCDGGGCSLIEYGDDHDIMGNIAAAHTNAFQKERLGWLNYGASPPIQAVTSSGTYTIDPMASPGVYPKALKILKSGTTAGSREFYYVEMRTPSGFDAAATSGVLIHTGSESTANSSIEIDLSPSTSSFDSILDVGQTFTDSSIGLTIRTLSATSGGATVEVSVNGGGAPACTAQAPTISFSPSGTQTTDPGQAVVYSVTVRNNDDASCASTTFALGASLPSGWSGGFDRPSVSMAPGTNGIAVLTVTPSTSASGTSSFTTTATRSGSTGPGGSASGSIAVSAPSGPIAVSASASVSRGTAKLSATVTSGGSGVGGASVTFEVIDPDGGSRTITATTSSNGDASASLRLRRKDPSGTYQVVVTATNGSSSATTTTTFVN